MFDVCFLYHSALGIIVVDYFETRTMKLTSGLSGFWLMEWCNMITHIC